MGIVPPFTQFSEPSSQDTVVQHSTPKKRKFSDNDDHSSSESSSSCELPFPSFSSVSSEDSNVKPKRLRKEFDVPSYVFGFIDNFNANKEKIMAEIPQDNASKTAFILQTVIKGASPECAGMSWNEMRKKQLEEEGEDAQSSGESTDLWGAQALICVVRKHWLALISEVWEQGRNLWRKKFPPCFWRYDTMVWPNGSFVTVPHDHK